MLERVWLTADGKKIDLVTELKAMVANSDYQTRNLYIGTDSQKHEKRHEYVTCVVVHIPGKGGRFFYSREVERKYVGLREKLFKEAYLSLETAMELSPVFPLWPIEVHIDANTNIKHKSAQYAKQLAGMISAQGFDTKLKPEAFVASHVSEHLVKYRHIKD